MNTDPETVIFNGQIFTKVNTKENDDCLLGLIAVLVDEYYLNLKMRVLSYIRDNREYFKRLVPFQEIDRFCENVEQKITCDNLVIMQALADCTNLNITIHHRSIDINPIFYQCEGEPIAEINVLHSKQKKFSFLLPTAY
ncbi:hypothetical protein BpHYR1_023852 [Brachionus plicatilis]|uniref:OTU domain-containing protein n=1 Tax=Brachionus plicatilis TaxID=10195 RepID=A0A3M7RVI8_BRAPC|nr:hypothetical protein BpHYR1_023852 [Brachionus plicatilis]